MYVCVHLFVLALDRLPFKKDKMFGKKRYALTAILCLFSMQDRSRICLIASAEVSVNHIWASQVNFEKSDAAQFNILVQRSEFVTGVTLFLQFLTYQGKTDRTRQLTLGKSQHDSTVNLADNYHMIRQICSLRKLIHLFNCITITEKCSMEEKYIRNIFHLTDTYMHVTLTGNCF